MTIYNLTIPKFRLEVHALPPKLCFMIEALGQGLWKNHTLLTSTAIRNLENV